MTKNNDLGLASIPAVTQYIQLAEALNIDIAPIINKLDIDKTLLSDASKHVTGAVFQELIAELVNSSDDPLFGLHTAKFVQPGSYSVLGFITMNCETLGEAIAKIQPFEKLVGDMGTTQLNKIQSDLYISWHCIFTNPIVKQHMVDNCLASWFTFAQFLVEPKYKEDSLPKKVLLKRSKPSLEEQSIYHDTFKCQVLFNQEQDAIIFDQALLALPLNKGNKLLLTTLENHAEELIVKLSDEDDFCLKVRNLIEINLINGKFHQQDIADLLKLSTKTLQRKLKVNNTTFKSILDEVRLDNANSLLTKANLPLVDVSINLGFSEPRSFYRWFQKLTGVTPGDYRTRNTPN
jgi:AraC-like DNA-binding protein